MSINKHSSNKTADIISTLNIPYSQLQIYTYSIPSLMEEKIKVGQLVEIFFRRRKIKGVVIKINSNENKTLTQKPKMKLSPILRSDDSGIILSKTQIKLAEFISGYYHTSLGLVIKTILPSVTKKEPRKKIEFDFPEEISKILKKRRLADSEIKNLTQKILKNEQTLFIHNLTAARHQIYLELIKKIISKNQQVILLLPDYFDIRQFAGFYFKKLKEKSVAVLRGEITKNQFYKEWKKVNSGEAKLIIGSRLAIFAPVKKLGLIIMDDEHNSNYKQWDQSPRYHTREIAVELAKITNSKIILSSPAPSLESFYGIKDKQLFPSREGLGVGIPLSGGARGGYLTHPQPPLKRGIIKIIDMNQERQKRNFSIFGDELKDSLIEQLKNKKQIIFFVPRRGFNTITLCQNCGYIAECPQCRSPLVSLRNKNLICYHCRSQIKAPTKCPICQSVRIKSFGAGADKVKEEIKSIIFAAAEFNLANPPERKKRLVRICQLDSGSVKNKKSQYKIYNDFSSGKIDILVGTQMILKNWNLSNLGLIGVISADSFLNFPDFRSQEKSFQLLKQTVLQNQNDAEIIIQTRHPENRIFKAVLSGNPERFYRQELENRKISFGLDYPPFSQIIKLTHQNKSAHIGERNAREMYRILRNKISEIDNISPLLRGGWGCVISSQDESMSVKKPTPSPSREGNNKFEIAEPFPAFNYQVRGKFRWHIIIKSICQDIFLRDEFLKLVGRDWIIDIDPEGLL